MRQTNAESLLEAGHRQTPNKQKSPSIQLGLFCLSRFQRARLNMQPKAAGAVCAPQLAAKLLRATAIYQAVLDEQMSFAPHVRWCCGYVENGSTGLSGQIYPVPDLSSPWSTEISPDQYPQ